MFSNSFYDNLWSNVRTRSDKALSVEHQMFTLVYHFLNMLKHEGKSDRPYQILIWGATGFTGRLMVEHAVNHAPAALRWAIGSLFVLSSSQ